MRLLRLPCPLLIIGMFLNAPYANGQPPWPGGHVAIPARSYYFQYRIEGAEEPAVVRVPIELASITTATELDQVIELPAPLSPIRLPVTCRACHQAHASRQPKLITESVPFGNWEIPISYRKTATGGSCQPGCHKRYRYDRDQAVINVPRPVSGSG